MSGRPFSRVFEHALRGPFRVPPEGGGARSGAAVAGEKNRSFVYEVLTQVSFRHLYDNNSDFSCSDFTVLPTPASAALMNSLGLLFKATSSGFSVLYDSRNWKQLRDYLRRQGEEWEKNHPNNPGKQVWTRLSFVMSLRDSHFINATDIPVDTNLSVSNFYFTNQDAHEEDTLLLLNRGSHATDEQLLPVAGVQVAVPIGNRVDRVVFRDISGEEVLCKPRCVPCWVAKLKRADMLTCADRKIPRPPGETCKGNRCTNRLFFDLSLLPEGRYQVQKLSGGVVLKSTDLLYSYSGHVPCGFIDLLFTRPKPGSQGLYPVLDLFGEARVDPRLYTLAFRNRETLWRYYIVPPNGKTFIDPRIEGGREGDPPVEFYEPEEVTLPTGAKALRFDSKVPIPLQERSEYHFSFEGRQGMPPHQKVRVDRLPVASDRQVIPAIPHDASDVFVYV